MHPVGQTWIGAHNDAVEDFGASQCQAGHGLDYRGTVLSRMQRNRTVNAFGSRDWWRGFQVGCYYCHQGPGSDDENSNTPAVVGNLNTNITSGTPVAMALTGTDANGNALTFRIVSQPEHGAVGLSNRIATYFPAPGFVGTDRFTFAAWDGSTDSNLGTGTVAVAQGPFSITAQAHAPPTYPMAWPAPFSVVPVVDNLVATPTFDWDFGDGSPPSTSQFPTHTYAGPGDHIWRVVSTVRSGPTTTSCTNTGSIMITGEMAVSGAASQSGLTISWSAGPASAVLETSDYLGPLADWRPVPNAAENVGGLFNVIVNDMVGSKFFRVRQVK
jgi:PKD repeat protein